MRGDFPASQEMFGTESIFTTFTSVAHPSKLPFSSTVGSVLWLILCIQNSRACRFSHLLLQSPNVRCRFLNHSLLILVSIRYPQLLLSASIRLHVILALSIRAPTPSSGSPRDGLSHPLVDLRRTLSHSRVLIYAEQRVPASTLAANLGRWDLPPLLHLYLANFGPGLELLMVRVEGCKGEIIESYQRLRGRDYLADAEAEVCFVDPEKKALRRRLF